MEAVPRLSMQSFALKTSPEGTSFANLKKFIAECYKENPDSYSKEVYELELLRNSAMHPTKDVSGCKTMKRYYCQLRSLINRFPSITEVNITTFTWKGLYNNNVVQVEDIYYELAAVLYNIAALHTQLGAAASRVDSEGMKIACTHFQCAAWAFGELEENFRVPYADAEFASRKFLMFLKNLTFAQAQECILEKSLIDNRKPAVVAKVTAQIISYYKSAMDGLMTTGNSSTAEIVSNSLLKEWKRYVKFKISYMFCILYLFQGQQAEEQQKMGERVTLYQAAWDKLEEAKKDSKGMTDQKQISETLTFTTDVVEAKRKNAKDENEFIYHEAVPDLNDIEKVQAVNVVNGIAFSVTDPEVAGEDIFARLVPMQAHEASSLYSEEKAQLLRKYGTQIEEKDNELAIFMSSLNTDHLNVSEERNSKIPQGIVDRCASLNAKPNAIPDLIASMSNLADICCDVETHLKEIKDLLNAEDVNEKAYQKQSGVHRTNVHVTELSREYQKYLEAHQKAGESNDTLRRAMELHVNNLRILSKPLQEIQSSAPKLSSDVNDSIFQELKLLLNKVNEMKAQRAQFHADLRIAINDDDITSKIIAYGTDKELTDLFKQEMGKHDKICTLIEKNLAAQTNILTALRDAYAKTAPALKAIADIAHKKETFFTSLAASYDAYEDLLGKSAKGLEFYKKLQGNVTKLLSRVKAARDVQDEERQQRLSSVREIRSSNDRDLSRDKTKSNQPKLKDFLKSGKGVSTIDTTYIPPVRPNPLGSEAPSTATCVPASSTSYTQHAIQQQPDATQTVYTSIPQYYDASGYTNPIYQNNQMYDQTAKVDPNYAMYQNQMSNYQNPTYMNQNASNPGFTVPQHNQPTLAGTTQLGTGQNFLSDQGAYAPTALSSQYPTQTYDSSSTSLNKAPPSNASAHQYPIQNPAMYQQQNYDIQGSYQNTIGHVQDSSAYPSQGSVTSIPAQATSSAQMNPNWNAASLPRQLENMNLQNNYTSYQQQPQQYDANAIHSYGQLQQMDSNIFQPAHYTQYTNSIPNQTSHTTDSSNLSVVGQSFANQYSVPVSAPQPPDSSVSYSSANYYTTPYGYQSAMQSNAVPHAGYDITAPQNYPQYMASTQSMTYMHSNNGSSTETTLSGTYVDTSAATQNDPSVTQPQETQQPAQSAVSTAYPDPQVQAHYQQNNQIPISKQNTMPTDQSQVQETKAIDQIQSHTIQNTIIASQPLQPIIQHHAAPAITPTTTTTQQHIQPTETPLTNSVAQQHVPFTTPTVSQQKPQPKPSPKLPERKAKVQTSNIDLLSDIDFSPAAMLSTPTLQPQLAPPSRPESIVSTKEPVEVIPSEVKQEEKNLSPSKTVEKPLESFPNETDLKLVSSDRKSSCDNISVCSDLSSIDQNFDWDSISVRNEKVNTTSDDPNKSPSNKPKDPFDDTKVLKYFHKEVESYEKIIESLNIKMLNGNTPLVNKWKELQDLLVKDEAKRTTSVAKLFPEKNRTPDCIPYDHARVVLERNTDDYINAAYIKDLGAKCPTFIIAQTPMANTVNDFWSMIWSQKSRTVVCLHTPNEILDTFWPQTVNQDMHFDDFTVTLVKQFDLSHCIELNLKVTLSGADAILYLSLLQIKSWVKNSPTHILGIARNILVAYKLRSLEFKSNAPLIMNCLTGSERSGLVALALCAQTSTETRRPVIIDVVDVWYRICSQRKAALRDTNNLQLSMQIVLSHAHEVLNKRGIMTSYQMKNAQTAIAVEKEEAKDPLMDLDPLWNLKKK